MQLTGQTTADNLMSLEAYTKWRKIHKPEVLAHRKLRSVHLGENVHVQFESETTIHNIQPGPQVMTGNPELFWGLIASMWIGNAMLVVLNLPLIGIWIKLLTVPYRWLFPSIVLFCAIGVFSTNNTTFDIWMVGLFGFIGYLFIKLGTEPAPLLLGFILGPMMEEYLRRALLLSRGDWSVLVTRPLSAGLLLAAALLLVAVLLPSVSKKREDVFVED